MYGIDKFLEDVKNSDRTYNYDMISRAYEFAKEAHLGQKRRSGEESCCIWLEIGNHRIKIFGNSGISTVTCDKMISRKILTLPDGSVLPVALLVERLRPWQGIDVVLDREDVCGLLTKQAADRVLQQMQAGEILNHQVQLRLQNGCYVLSSMAECREMIAATVEAKWSEEDFADD